jgi:hypothetical protein
MNEIENTPNQISNTQAPKNAKKMNGACSSNK